MSLTSILSYNNKQFIDFRALLEELFPTPKFVGEGSIKVEPQTKNYGLIGIAFDYLLRFSLEKKYKSLVHARPWVAENALQFFIEGGFTHFGNPDDIDFDNIDTLMEGKNKVNKRINSKFENCKTIYKEFINNQIDINDDLLEVSLFLSRLDLIARDPFKNELRFDPENAQDLSDLRQLLQNCNLDLFCPKEKIILNPTFGKGSQLVGGADADLIVDSTLIDIKTTKEQKITRPIFNQLIGYYLLYLIGGIDNHIDSKIEKIGLHFSRYNYLWTLPIKKIGSEDDFNKAVIKLKSKFKSK
jgi:hypothetical protein